MIRLKYSWWWKFILLLIGFYLTAFGSLKFSDCWAEKKYPQSIEIQQLFRKGDRFSYKITKISTTGMEESEKIISQGSAILSLKVIRVNKDKTVDIVITKESGSNSIKSKILGTSTKPDTDIGEQTKIRLYPNEQSKVLSGNLSLAVWNELIPQEFPAPSIKVGDSLALSKLLPQAGKVEIKYNIIGFEKIKGFDCVKIEIESTGNIKRETEREYQLFMVKMKKELYIAYKKGYPIIKSHTISETTIGTTSSVRETIVELLK